MDIIPAIDIIDGKCVRLVKGDFMSKKVYSSEPLEVAKKFESWGIKRLHLVDLDGAIEKKIINHKILAGIASGTGLIVDFGGGLRTENDIRIAFENGASMITVGSIAVSDPQLFIKWLNDFGSEKIILGADYKNERVALNGWSEDSNMELFLFLQKYINEGVTKVICTDINKDGMLKGPSVDVYKRVLEKWPELYLVASGGVSTPKDLLELDEIGIPAVIIGKAIYENRITREDLQLFIN
jgi:phosphoribosylformimino-5-aminoimidazole carboxamide ribotide isomerase